VKTSFGQAFGLALVCAAFAICACGTQKVTDPPEAEIRPEAYLSPKAQDSLMYALSRYICKFPSGAGEPNKWDARFDSAYAAAVRNHKLRFYHVDSTEGVHYYFTSRVAPSMVLKYVGLAGKFVPDDAGGFLSYREEFRTWKKIPEEHLNDGEMLFRKFVRGEDLTPYYTENSGGAEYIEFPDSETWYDEESRTWRSQRGDVLAPYRQGN